MKKAILATKVGMTQIFNEDGVLTPVTVLQAGPCVVTQVKTVENDGYDAVQVGFADIKEKLVSKPVKGHFDKAEVPYKRFVREFKFEMLQSIQLKMKSRLISLLQETKLTQLLFQRVKVSRVQSRDWASQEDLWLTVLNSTDIRVQTDQQQHLVEYSREKECLDIWVQRESQSRISK